MRSVVIAFDTPDANWIVLYDNYEILDQPVSQELSTERPQVNLWTIFKLYFIVGLTAFSMFIIQKLKAMVLNNHWLSEEEVVKAWALCNYTLVP